MRLGLCLRILPLLSFFLAGQGFAQWKLRDWEYRKKVSIVPGSRTSGVDAYTGGG